MGEYKNAYKMFVRKLENREPIWGNVGRWGDNIKIGIYEKFIDVAV